MQPVRFRTGLLPLVILLSAAVGAPTGQESPHPDSGFVAVEGGRIYYEKLGEGPAIIMIHDGILHSVTWDGQFEALAENYQVIRWDRRGFGRSGPPQAPFSNVDDLFALTKALGIERAMLMGCSSGGLLAIYFALEHPQLVSSMVLVGPIVSGFDFSDHFRTRGNRGYPKSNAPVEEQIHYWSWTDPWITSPENTTARKKIAAILTENPQDLEGSGSFARWPRGAALGRLSEIKVPTLLVAGESDIPDVHAHVGVIQAGITGARRVILPGSGHLAHFEVPDRFNSVVADFLATAKNSTP